MRIVRTDMPNTSPHDLNEACPAALSQTDALLGVVCGAGISQPSGLPLAHEIVEGLLEAVTISEADRQLVSAQVGSLEVFLEGVLEDSDLRECLDVFKSASPSKTHLLVAQLIRRRAVRDILTPNLDCLLERAIQDTAGRQSLPEVLCDEQSFRAIREHGSTGVVITKLHGSISDWGSIRSTLKVIAAKRAEQSRSDAAKYMFADGPHSQVWVLGYSCSDKFDVNPVLRSIRGSVPSLVEIALRV